MEIARRPGSSRWVTCGPADEGAVSAESRAAPHAAPLAGLRWRLTEGRVPKSLGRGQSGGLPCVPLHKLRKLERGGGRRLQLRLSVVTSTASDQQVRSQWGPQESWGSQR
ncbi:hypothetical protein NDU88_000966 [Pleurodeles waltl]|uniref:Uncharacterized protein n=1 Tax=Pleurodeles waltl TaxID=8319 RepID=A0AAV7Q5K2_PLEWA|nr:hypothetical protein NDU88_000966 [Pleurodeles waltl]